MTKLKYILPKKSGRSKGKITVRHQGGRQKRFYRDIDFKRSKKDIWAKVESFEFDPNRNVDIALLCYEDGERKYILTPQGLKIGAKIIASEDAPIEIGNSLPLNKIPVGTQIHNLEIRPNKGGQIVKSAGSVAVIQGKEKTAILVKLPSGEVRRFENTAWASVGQVGNVENKSIRYKKAGRNIRLGIRPTVRGVAQHPDSHPHGGGEGRSGIGMKYPKTPYGKPAVGKTRRKRKYSNNLIVKPRKKGKHS
ncbi:MAG: 50S ribosomal protein L2 [Candidatus Woesebacteria bacterium GW2011_GWA1_37_7]|uniref:50S ribosomal protein L2 n=1 Tax=Candidatus Woesebacteria bacterium GW2011_GWA1_37_7 TaxID=1618545 RepID=A0A0G0JKV8_9BACT|nr:MAG: 50S ribosomal protein L2 [Candidatus Woesebacteria bacterium GW2011_GWA1_37_7]